jgi:hypothetical protein
VAEIKRTWKVLEAILPVLLYVTHCESGSACVKEF